jgi:hypothetical protein
VEKQGITLLKIRSKKGILPQGFFASRKTLSAPEKHFGAAEQGIIV